MSHTEPGADLATLHAAAGNLQLARCTITDAVAHQMVFDAIGLVHTAIQRLHQAQVIQNEEARREASMRAGLHLVPGDQA